MTTREQWILFVGLVTLAVTLAILALLVYRGGRSLETKKVLDAIEGTRQQVDTLEQTIAPNLRIILEKVKILLVRFGFLKGGS
jgi:uncharacterized protein YoxC